MARSGTGKTYALIEIILQLVHYLPKAKILVATQSNNAANIIAARLIAANIDIGDEMLRVVSKSVVDKKKLPKDLQKYSASIMHGEIDHQDEEECDAGSIRVKMDHLKRFRIIIGTCVGLGAIANSDMSNGHFTHILIDEAAQCIGMYGHNLFNSENCVFILINMFFVSEPEAMIPISLLNPANGQIIMAGDPLQVCT